MSDLLPIFDQFQLGGKIVNVEPFGNGNINETYRSTIQGQTRQYVHQKINTGVFREPENVMENMVLVTRHIRQQFARHPVERRRETLELVPTRDGKLLYVDEQGHFWRTTVCIPHITTCDTIHNRQHAHEVGKTLGEFQRLVADIPKADLHDTLPGYHHTPVYYDDLLTVYSTPHANPAIGRRQDDDDVKTLFRNIQKYTAVIPLLMDAQQAGRLRNRVVHNDPKVNNFLLDADTQRGIGMIDLDTVKPGLIHFDYGDCLRTAANPAGEETRDMSAVYFDGEIFEAVSRGYLEEAREFLSDDDVDLLVDAIKVITLEQTIRFFSDYVNGDVYYRNPTYPTQNLNRAQVQWTLFQDITRQEARLRQTLENCW